RRFSRRRRPAFRYCAEARHHAARPSRQRPRLLSLHLQRRRPRPCRRHGAGRADDHARSGGARARRLLAGLLRETRPQVPNLRAVDRIGCADPVRHADPPLARSSDSNATEGVMTTNITRGDSRLVRTLPRLFAAAATVFLLAMASAASAQQSFKTPEEAAEALVNAARNDDRKALLAVLGANGAD